MILTSWVPKTLSWWQQVVSNNCKDSITKTVTVATLTGIQELKQGIGNIVIYPNPTKDIINIDFKGISEDVSVSLYNVLGAKVFDKQFKKASNIKKIDVSELPNDIYLLILDIKGSSKTIKIEKE